MRFLVDASTGLDVVHHLRASGHDILAVAEIMPYAQDNEILIIALKQERILITNDKDFGELVFRSDMGHVGVILMRLRDESPEHRVAIIDIVLQNHSNQLSGSFVVVTEDKVRIRPSDRSSGGNSPLTDDGQIE